MAFGLKRKAVDELMKRGIVAMIEPGAVMEGKLSITTGTVRLNSHFKGEISGDGSVLVAERAEVEADIKVKSVTVSGKVKGSVHVSDRVEIKERGVILGDIYTPVLIVEPGGYFDGQCHMPAQASESSQIADLPIRNTPGGP
jgi:cytoskeletal protein CcmA (bactofilin family)